MDDLSILRGSYIQNLPKSKYENRHTFVMPLMWR
jgi:hypothetical protein